MHAVNNNVARIHEQHAGAAPRGGYIFSGALIGGEGVGLRHRRRPRSSCRESGTQRHMYEVLSISDGLRRLTERPSMTRSIQSYTRRTNVVNAHFTQSLTPHRTVQGFT